MDVVPVLYPSLLIQLIVRKWRVAHADQEVTEGAMMGDADVQ